MNSLPISELASARNRSELRDSKIQPINASRSPAMHTPLRESVERALTQYFNQLDGQPATNIYEMVLAEVEAPMLKKVLEYTRGNQTRAAEALGLNRGTLRKKLKQYDLL